MTIHEQGTGEHQSRQGEEVMEKIVLEGMRQRAKDILTLADIVEGLLATGAWTLTKEEGGDTSAKAIKQERARG